MIDQPKTQTLDEHSDVSDANTSSTKAASRNNRSILRKFEKQVEQILSKVIERLPLINKEKSCVCNHDGSCAINVISQGMKVSICVFLIKSGVSLLLFLMKGKKITYSLRSSE